MSIPGKVILDEAVAKGCLEYLLTRPMREVEVLVYHLRAAVSPMPAPMPLKDSDSKKD